MHLSSQPPGKSTLASRLASHGWANINQVRRGGAARAAARAAARGVGLGV
jgi:hypothetical protein